MEKWKDHAEHTARMSSPTTNPSNIPPNQVLPISFYPHFSTPPTTNPSNIPATQGNVVSPFDSSISLPIGVRTASSSHVKETIMGAPESKEAETLSPSDRNTSESNDGDDSGTQNRIHIDRGYSIEEPKLGMVFKSEEDLVSCYKSYGKHCGFGVMTQRSKREADGSLNYITLGCSRGGKARNQTSNVARPRSISKTDCKVKLNATFIDGVLKVLIVHNSHNYSLSLQKSRFFRCNREVSESVKRMLDTNDQAGIRMNKSFAALMQEAGGFENLSFLDKNFRNYIDKARHLRLGKGGAQTL
ncbi:hypothetical protein I3842_08G127000 [Carya illinoinensis]|uniref:FAR1 domain-containing protein n=1 Tax=Carya illinoinensis TaxID=32201 RepID=A0A922EBX0_CARIL|nr:hypothetical protein I3842_08G127000 [Carya illinoinensis]